MSKLMVRTLVLSIALGLPLLSHARPADLKKYKEFYPAKATEASCKTCHTKGKELNDYGKALKNAGMDFAKAPPKE